jgi:hypothetical protein
MLQPDAEQQNCTGNMPVLYLQGQGMSWWVGLQKQLQWKMDQLYTTKYQGR